MTSPMVSVIIPTFNRPRELERAIKSVLAQTLQDLELIVVDDSGTESARPVIETFDDARVHYLPHLRNSGLAAARNSGIRAAESDVIAFCDDDDFLDSDFLEITVKKLRSSSPNVAYVVPTVLELDLRAQTPRFNIAHPQLPLPESDGKAVLQFLYSIPFSGWFPTIRKEVFESIGTFDETLPDEPDRDLLIRIAETYTYEVELKSVAIHIFHTSEHMNVYGPRKLHDLIRLRSRYQTAIEANPLLRHRWDYKLGWIAMRCGEVSIGRSFLRAALGEGLGGSSRFIARAYLVAPGMTTRVHHLLGRMKRSRKFFKVRSLKGSDTFQGFDAQRLQTLISLACATKT